MLLPPLTAFLVPLVEGPTGSQTQQKAVNDVITISREALLWAGISTEVNMKISAVSPLLGRKTLISLTAAPPSCHSGGRDLIKMNLQLCAGQRLKRTSKERGRECGD